MRIVLLNGPPRSGKDTIARALRPAGFYQASLARLLKERVHRLFGLDVPFDYFEETKDQPRVEFGGATPRQVYIDTSEKVVKPIMGRDIWARWLRQEMDNLDGPRGHRPEFMGCNGFVVSDLGFPYEVTPLVQGFDPLIVRLHRANCTFANDSREYVTVAGVPTLELYNEGTREELERDAVAAITSHFAEAQA